MLGEPRCDQYLGGLVITRRWWRKSVLTQSRKPPNSSENLIMAPWRHDLQFYAVPDSIYPTYSWVYQLRRRLLLHSFRVMWQTRLHLIHWCWSFKRRSWISTTFRIFFTECHIKISHALLLRVVIRYGHTLFIQSRGGSIFSHRLKNQLGAFRSEWMLIDILKHHIFNIFPTILC